MGLPNVINLHITEACNYRCKYCFAKFKVEDEFKLKEWIKVVDKIKDFFTINNLKGRLNIAGGEPMIAPYFYDLVDYIHQQGIEISIITNASQLSKENNDKLIGKVSTIGISIDSLNYDKNLEIGRSQGSKAFNYDELIRSLKYIQKHNIKLKVNTVVSKLNINEDIIKLYKDIKFDRIKILQIKVNEGSNEFAKRYQISNEEFKLYVEKIKSNIKDDLIVEDNTDMEDAYIIIDPKGRMISNNNNEHTIIGNVLNEDVKTLIVNSNYKHSRFKKRY